MSGDLASTQLRVATAGSVDDGKSTLIGRLLVDTKTLFDDQAAAVSKASRRYGGGELNLALVTDGLRAEREQGITIDVAYRYLATPRRSFVIADTPGHAQYTRNMVTGASVSDVAVVLVDARKGLVEQSRRHLYLAALLGARLIVLAVNKMDLADWDETAFRSACRQAEDYLAAQESSIPLVAVPLSALHGDNVVERSAAAPWYSGPPLLELLEGVEVLPPDPVGARLAVQWVIAPGSHGEGRGYAGRLSGGPLAIGDLVQVLPSGRLSQVARLDRAGDPVDGADIGAAITIFLTDDLDVGRGDVVVAVDAAVAPTVTQEIEVDLCWMLDRPLRLGDKLVAKHLTRTVNAVVTELFDRRDVVTLQPEAAHELHLNDLSRAVLLLSQPIVADTYAMHREGGRLILAESATGTTAAAVLIRRVVPVGAPLKEATR